VWIVDTEETAQKQAGNAAVFVDIYTQTKEEPGCSGLKSIMITSLPAAS
jgi:hypothetical protein